MGTTSYHYSFTNTTATNWSNYKWDYTMTRDVILNGALMRDAKIRTIAIAIRTKEKCSMELAELKALLKWEALDDEAILCL